MNRQNGNQFQEPRREPFYPQKRKSGFATAGLVLGIVAIAISFIPIVNNASFVLGILAAIFGLVALIKRASVGKSVTALILGILAIVITLSLQASWSKAIDDTVDEFDDIFAELEEDMGYMAGDKTDEILKTYLDVTFGTFQVIEGDFLDETELTVTIKNKANEAKSYSITVEAVDSNGNRIATDSVYATDLGAGQGQTFKAFTYVADDDVDALKSATFRVASVSMY